MTPEIESIRPSHEAIDSEFGPGARRSLLTQVMQEPRRRSTGARWVSMGVAAAAGVTALALGLQALGGGATREVAEPTEQPAESRTADAVGAAEHDPAVDVAPASITMPSLDRGVVVSGSSLGAVAAAAAGKSVAGEGNWLHVVTISEQTGLDGPSRREIYVDADGWTWTHQTGFDPFWAIFAPITGAWADLPTDPVELDAVLRSGSGSHSADERVFKGITEVLLAESASPQVRAAAIIVLQNLAENPADPTTDREGVLVTPRFVVTTMELPEGGDGYRVTYTDETSRPGVEQTLVLDSEGWVVETGSSWGDDEAYGQTAGTYTSVVVTREWVDVLPDAFSTKLGTQQVPKEIDG